MQSQKKIILFELNEVPYRVVDEFRTARPESTFARLYDRCRCYETYTEDVSNLSPWKTWPSLHRGVNDEAHLIHDFGQDLTESDKAYPPIWKMLAAAGVEVGLCGSLHSYPMPDDLEPYAFYIPDAFATGSECFPKTIEAFQRFNLQLSRESARNVSARVPWKEAIDVLRTLPDLGFKMTTMLDVGKQLVSERLQNWRKIRRRTYQAVLAFDIFMKQLDRTRPAFASFFTNHVASSMHRYWAARFPDDYDVFEFEDEWVRTYQSEIDFTMHRADVLFSRLVAFADRNPEYSIWVATSMGQAATRTRPRETQLYLTDLEKFMASMDVEPDQWSRRPAMLPQANVVVEEPFIEAFREKLQSLRIDGKPVRYREKANGFFSMNYGHPNLYDRPSFAELGEERLSFQELGLENVKIDDKCGVNAYHIPQGCLMIYDPTDREPRSVERPQVSALEVAPTILRNYGVPVPPYMRRPASLPA